MANNTSAYLCLGSNKGDTRHNLEAATALLKEAEGLQILDCSPIYYTEPQELKDQAWFSNQVVRISCSPKWTAQKLLTFTLHLEEILGRTRPSDMALRFGPRIIDIDLLLFGHEQSQEPFCILPHPRMMERAFVLIPLRDVLEHDTLLTQNALEQALQKFEYRVQDNKIFQ